MIVVANWKMNLDFRQSLKLADSYLALNLPAALKIYVLASDLVLQDLVIKFKGSPISVFAQDCSRFQDQGSFTGEISAQQLKKLGVKGVLLGHLERRLHLGESNSDIALKLRSALAANLKVLLGIGDTIPGQSFKGDIEEINEQLSAILSALDPDEIKNLMIAYESVNSISSLRSQTDKEDDLDQIVMKLEFIESWFMKHFQIKVPILYGGSLAADDLKNLVSTKIVKGFLIGRNSLEIKEFKPIIKALALL
jgi:triosephosphate isomerase